MKTHTHTPDISTQCIITTTATTTTTTATNNNNNNSKTSIQFTHMYLCFSKETGLYQLFVQIK